MILWAFCYCFFFQRTKYGNKYEELYDEELSILDVMSKLYDHEVMEIMPVIQPLVNTDKIENSYKNIFEFLKIFFVNKAH